jgi:diguanylate cyclase (GGDEF)-like protein
MPTVYDIAIKNIITIDISKTLKEAIDMMALNNTRNIIILDEKMAYILTTATLIDFQLLNINTKTPLNKLNIPTAKRLHKDLNILNVLNQIDSSNEYMLIEDSKQELIGIVSYTDIIHNIDPEILMEKQTIGALMLNYQSTFIHENSSTLQAIKQIRRSANDAVVIVDEEEKPKGIFTSKDFIHIMNSNDNLSAPIKKYMSTPILTLHKDATIAKALSFIKEHHFKRIVAVDEKGYISGIITQKELLRVVYNKWIDFIKERTRKISQDNEQLLQSKCELEEIASIDFLTQIYNRQKFEHFLEYEIHKTSRYKNETFSIVLMDLDHFKSINDTYGHLEGDMILKEVARLLKLCSRESDIIARWGGEEFIMLLPHTNLEESYLVGEKLRTTIELHEFHNNVNITCSIGVAQCHEKDSLHSLFKRADVALYKAKQHGRNQILLENIEALD